MVDFANMELSGTRYREIYKQRVATYGFHPTCVGCLKMKLCLVANMPGYEFTCNERVVAGAPDREGRSRPAAPPFAPPVKKSKKHGGW